MKYDDASENAESFFDYYGSRGWTVGKAKTKMTDWHRAMSGWVRRSKEFNKHNEKIIYKESYQQIAKTKSEGKTQTLGAIINQFKTQ